MAHWLYRLFLMAFIQSCWMLSGALAQDDSAHTEVIAPDIEPREIKIARIDNEFIEINLHGGLLSIEDFDSSALFGARIALHLNEHIFIEGSYSQAKGDRTSFEELIPNAQVVSDDNDRDYKSWDVSLGWNVFPNESWLFGRAYKSDVYTLVGAGRTDFGGDKWFTVNLGLGYRLFLTDWLIYRIEVRDHIFNRDIFGEDDQTNNIEFSTGVSYFF